MDYMVNINGKSYELPKKTVTVMEKMDEALTVDGQPGLSIRQKYEKLHRIARELLGEEKAAEILGGTALSEIDLSELALLILKMNDAYERALKEYKADAMKAQMDELPLEKIISMTKAAQTMQMKAGLAR